MNTSRPHFCIHLGLYSNDAHRALMLLLNSEEAQTRCYSRDCMLSYVMAVQDSTGETMIVPFWDCDDNDIDNAMTDDGFTTYDEFLMYMQKAIKSLVRMSRRERIKLHAQPNGECSDDYNWTRKNTLCTIPKIIAKFIADWICTTDKDKIYKKYGKTFVDKMIGTPRNIIDVQMIDALKDELKEEIENFELEKSKIDDTYRKEREASMKKREMLREELIKKHDAKVKKLRKMINDITSKKSKNAA